MDVCDMEKESKKRSRVLELVMKIQKNCFCVTFNWASCII